MLIQGTLAVLHRLPSSFTSVIHLEAYKRSMAHANGTQETDYQRILAVLTHHSSHTPAKGNVLSNFR